ncbi:MAG: hypothetical protein JWP52_11 [Rhizobacter sp.]|nr:hypothetical protein [Rhizobacter sp.]
MTSVPISPPQRPANYSPTINGFRGICVAMVFLHHVGNSGLPPVADPASFWQTFAHASFMSFRYGVELFFMISGYVILNSLRRHATIGGFLRDRVLRIFPVWLPVAVLLVIASTAVARHGFEVAPLSRWLVVSVANVLLIPPLWPMQLAHPASWSLTYEWVFYLASALAAFLWRRPGTQVLAKVAWGVGVVALIVCFPRALYFLPGVLVALAPQWVRGVQRAPALAYVSLPLFLWAWYSTDIQYAEYDKPLWAFIQAGHGAGVVVAFLAATHLFASVVAPRPRGLGVLCTRAVQHLGTISYSFYLVHPLVMSAVKFVLLKLMPQAHGSWTATLVFTLVSAPIAWALSYASWLWLEQRLARWLKSKGPDAKRASAHGAGAVPASASRESVAIPDADRAGAGL